MKSARVRAPSVVGLFGTVFGGAACVGLLGCGGSFESRSSRDAGAKDGSAGSGGAPSTGGAGGSPFSGGSPSTGGVPSSGAAGGASGGGGAGGSAGSGGSAASGGASGSGGVPSTGGSGGSPASGGAPQSGGAGGSSGTGGSSGSCGSAACDPLGGLACCGDACVNLENDPHNCGKCGTVCPDNAPFCEAGVCGTPPCTPPPGAGACAPDSTCCGTTCCASGQICCAVPHNFTTIGCYDPSQSNGTCPVGCPACICASPDTPVATPNGERAIASLEVGDRVLSVDRGRVVDVPILEIHRTPVRNHHVVHVELASGAVLEISAPHPTADGRTFGDLRAGESIGGVAIEEATVVPYHYPFTYDILPASDSGTYFAGGVLIGSTLGGSALSPGGSDYSTLSLPPDP